MGYNKAFDTHCTTTSDQGHLKSGEFPQKIRLELELNIGAE